MLVAGRLTRILTTWFTLRPVATYPGLSTQVTNLAADTYNSTKLKRPEV
jgi:hypothetical protein